MLDEKPPLSELAHYGKKGMKWGVRQTYTARVQRRSNMHARVALKEGSLLDKTRVYGRVTQYELMSAGNNWQRAAAMKSVRLADHADRIQRGEATTRDKIVMYGSTRISDLRPVR